MTLVTSGEISIGGAVTNRSINLELGRAAGATSNLNESALRSLAGITTSGAQISLADFYGKSSLAAVLNQYDPSTYDIHLTRTHLVFAGGYSFAEVEIILDANGTAYYRYEDSDTATTNFTSFTWLTGGGTNANYYAYMTTPTTDTIGTFGNSPNGALNTLLQLNTTRSWSISVSSTGGAGAISWEVAGPTLSIRDASSNVLASRTLRMYVEANSINL